MRQSVWGYNPEEQGQPDTVKISGMQFSVASLFYMDGSGQAVYSGYRYTTELNGYFYVFHAFAKHKGGSLISNKFRKQVEEVILPTLKADKRF